MKAEDIFKIASKIQKDAIKLNLRKHVLNSELEKLLQENYELEQELAELKQNTPISGESAQHVKLIFHKFHQIVTQLVQRRENRTTLTIKDEYDVQDLLHALLRIYFQDVRSEEWCPSYAGNSYRTDFLLKNEKIIIEAKMTRGKSKNNKRISEELILDIAHYRTHPECQTLMCFIYDPAHLITNPNGFETDIQRNQSYPVIVTVNPKP